MKRIKQDPVADSTLSRTARRAVLAAALLVASPALADEAAKTSVRILPPPVLDAQTQTVQQVGLHQNPYCGPELKPISDPKVKLASSHRRSAVRLKETTADIGLVPIGTPELMSVPVNVRPPALKIDAPAVTEVQSNPLIQSEHHSNPNLIDTNVTMPNERLKELELTRRGADLTPAVRIAPHSQVAHPQAVHAQVAQQTPQAHQRPVQMASQDRAAPQQPKHGAAIPKHGAAIPPHSVLVRTPQPAAATAAPQPNPVAAPVPPAVAPVPPAVAPIPPAVAPTPLQPAASPSVATTQIAIQPAIKTPAPLPEPVALATPAVEPAPVAPPQAQEMPKLAAAPTSEPITFSMSDSSTSEDANSESPSDNSSTVAKETSTLPVPIKIAQPVEMAEPLRLSELQPIKKLADDGSVENLRPVMTNSAMTNSAAKAVPVVQDPVRSTIRIKTSDRYRAPVAVAAPPLSIASQKSKAATVKPAAPVRGLQAKNTRKNANKRRAPTKLHLTLAQVRSLTIGGHVRRIDVGNQDVCQAIATGPSQLKLIGTGNGITRLVVWADAHNSPTRVRSFEIHVEDAVETTGDSLGGKTRMLNESILQAFPNANVSVQQFQDRLIVAGDCDSEDTAKKIIRMVRKTCLIPVRDEIKVRQ